MMGWERWLEESPNVSPESLRRRRRVLCECAEEKESDSCRWEKFSVGLRGTGEGREDFAGDFFGGRREGTTECGVKGAISGSRIFNSSRFGWVAFAW